MSKLNYIKKFDIGLDYVKEAGIIYHKVKGFEVKTFLILFKEKMEILSTLDGYKKVYYVGNNYLPPSLWEFLHIDFERYKKYFYKSLKISKRESSFLFTGKDVETLSVKKEKFKGYEIYVLTTAGAKSNALRIGVDKGKNYENKGKFEKIGTVNIIVLTNMNLSKGAMAGSLINITEAKTIAFQELNIKSSFNPDLQATGTGTDNIIVVNGKNGKITYTGGHSKFGEILAYLVTKSVKEALLK